MLYFLLAVESVLLVWKSNFAANLEYSTWDLECYRYDLKIRIAFICSFVIEGEGNVLWSYFLLSQILNCNSLIVNKIEDGDLLALCCKAKCVYFCATFLEKRKLKFPHVECFICRYFFVLCCCNLWDIKKEIIVFYW